MHGKLSLLLILSFLTCTEAFADWREASSDHFVIYANDSEKDMRRFSEKLERYHDAVHTLFGSNQETISPSNRVNIYAVGSRKKLKDLYGFDNRFIGGFYIGRAGGSVAFLSKINSSRGTEASASERILLHEYAHHVLAGYSSFQIPRWFGEGFAEYFAQAEFKKDGIVGVGLPSVTRLYESKVAKEHVEWDNVSLEEVLDTRLYDAKYKPDSRRYNNFYGRSWVLFHYLYSDLDRRVSLVNYLSRINEGEDVLQAATAAFGDLQALEKSLFKYQKKKQWAYFKITPKAQDATSITIRTLSKAEAAIMPVHMYLKRGVSKKEAIDLAEKAQKVLKKHPDNLFVLTAVAEAENDARNTTAALIAADKALTIDPQNIDALIQKNYALIRTARETNNTDDWKIARKQSIAANRIENDHPVPLINYYVSFRAQGVEPSANAVAGLERALFLAPFDHAVRAKVALQQVTEQRYQEAIDTLSAVVNNPHAPANHPAFDVLEQAKSGLAQSSTPSIADDNGSNSSSNL